MMYIFSLVSCAFVCYAYSLPTIKTTVGEIQGIQEETTFANAKTNVLKFLGIPYAEPPIGDLRFRKPKPARHFRSVFIADQFGPGCLQNKFLMSMWLPGRDYLSEDCLTLNIFVPNGNFSEPLAVMLWIHGGAYQIGQSSIYSGENLAVYENIIVVTINYRLGPFGFMATNDPDALGNLGLWDQHLAIKWVHDNIAPFGGDPNRITIFGESAGGGSTIYQSMYPGNKGLITRVLSESGVAMSAWGYNTRAKMIDFTKRMAVKLNCPMQNDREMLQCLRSVPADDILAKSRVGTESENLFRPEFVPAPDGEFVLQYAPEIFQNYAAMNDQTGSVFDNIDMTIVALTGDGTVVTGATMLPYVQKFTNGTISPETVIEYDVIPKMLQDRYNMTSPELAKIIAFVYTDWSKNLGNKSYETELLNLDTDFSFFIPSIFTTIAHARRQQGKRTYLMGFARHSSFTQPLDYKPPNLHADEIPYFFGFPNSVLRPFAMSASTISAEEKEISERLMTYIANFAKTGDPNKPNPIQEPWQPYDLDNQHYLRVGEKIEAASRMLPMRTALWTDFIPDYIRTFRQSKISQTSHNLPIITGIFG